METLGNFLQQLAGRYGDKQALVHKPGDAVDVWSYNRLLDQANRNAAWLREHPAGDQDPVFATVRGRPLSRDAVERIVTKHVEIAATRSPIAGPILQAYRSKANSGVEPGVFLAGLRRRFLSFGDMAKVTKLATGLPGRPMSGVPSMIPIATGRPGLIAIRHSTSEPALSIAALT